MKSQGERKKSYLGFTLMEVLIVIGIVAVVATIVVFVINPGELLKRTRDSSRLSDIEIINKAIGVYSIEGTSFGSSSVVYVSIPDASSTCSNLGLPALDSPWTYGCSTQGNYQKMDGSGWIPLDFDSISIKRPMSHLPVDPVNTVAGDLYYTYVKGSWKLTARLEAARNIEKMDGDGGTDDSRMEKGNNLTLGPPVSSAPVVTAIDPTSGPNNATATISSITGSNFQSGATVKLTKTGQSNISCSSFTFTSSTQLSSGTCPINGAATGAWNVTVTNTDAKSGTFTNGFTVTSGGDADPPSPNPPTWSSAPSNTGTSTIAMTVSSSTDATHPIQYLFKFEACATDGGTGGTSSSWAGVVSHTDSGLQTNQCYNYSVTARDAVPNTGSPSATSTTLVYTSATTPGTSTIGGATTSTLTITSNDANGNPASTPTTQFAVQVSSTDASWNGKWIIGTSGNASASTTASWKSDATWDNFVINSLVTSTVYGFKVKARNADLDETSLSSEGQGTTIAETGNVALDTSSSGANATGGECLGSLAWDHTEICVNVASSTPAGSASTTVKSDSFDSNTASFTVE